MTKRIINSHDDFEILTGQELGFSDYIEVTQEMINRFADATHDHQWIHTDPEKAALESPFKATIAHGYLTLSLVTSLWHNVVEVWNVKLVVNYGLEGLRFNQPVVVNSRVNARFVLLSVTNLRGITRIRVKIVMQIEGQAKPAFECVAVFLYHFEK
jgi:acyl dehydratase